MSKKILIIGGDPNLSPLTDKLKEHFGDDTDIHTADEVVKSGLTSDEFKLRQKSIVIESVYQHQNYMPSSGQSRRRDRRKKNRKY